MTATTATWGIPYATSTDRPCDGATITESMAEAVDLILHRFDLDLAALVTIPYASLSAGVDFTTPPSTVTGAFAVTAVFDRALADTANLSNLSQNPSVIQVPPSLPGVYLTGTYAEAQLFPASTHTPGDGSFMIVNTAKDDTSATISRSESQVSNNATHDQFQQIGSMGSFVSPATTGYGVRNTINAFGSLNDTMGVHQQNLYVFWISD